MFQKKWHVQGRHSGGNDRFRIERELALVEVARREREDAQRKVRREIKEKDSSVKQTHAQLPPHLAMPRSALVKDR